MRLTIEDTRLVDERVGNRPVYLILARGADKVVRLKPQNLVAGLPLAATAERRMIGRATEDGMAMTETSREVGVVLRRRSIDNPWIDHMWSPAMILDEVPDTAPWTVLSTRGRCDDLLCGRSQHRPVQLRHRQLPRQPRRRRTANLDCAAAPGRRAELELTKVTADPTEGEAIFESGCDVIGTVPMPPEIAAWIAAFVDQFHVERVFHKRKRDHKSGERQRSPDDPGDEGTGRS